MLDASFENKEASPVLPAEDPGVGSEAFDAFDAC
jgi:hypothetical protein